MKYAFPLIRRENQLKYKAMQHYLASLLKSSFVEWKVFTKMSQSYLPPSGGKAKAKGQATSWQDGGGHAGETEDAMLSALFFPGSSRARRPRGAGEEGGDRGQDQSRGLTVRRNSPHKSMVHQRYAEQYYDGGFGQISSDEDNCDEESRPGMLYVTGVGFLRIPPPDCHPVVRRCRLKCCLYR
jgi:hypothetical protein